MNFLNINNVRVFVCMALLDFNYWSVVCVCAGVWVSPRVLDSSFSKFSVCDACSRLFNALHFLRWLLGCSKRASVTMSARLEQRLNSISPLLLHSVSWSLSGPKYSSHDVLLLPTLPLNHP